jgi:hypothetical protein
MQEENRPATPADGSFQLRTPAKLYFNAEPVSSLPPMSGAQATDPVTCPPIQAHQFICATGEVFTTVTPHCETRVHCLGGGIGPFNCPTGTPPPCNFKFFQNLCVEVDVTFTAEANCVLNQVQCLGVEPGLCPPQT